MLASLLPVELKMIILSQYNLMKYYRRYADLSSVLI